MRIGKYEVSINPKYFFMSGFSKAEVELAIDNQLTDSAFVIYIDRINPDGSSNIFKIKKDCIKLVEGNLESYSYLSNKFFNDPESFRNKIYCTLHKILIGYPHVRFTSEDINILRLFLLNRSTYYGNSDSGSGNIYNCYVSIIDKVLNEARLWD